VRSWLTWSLPLALVLGFAGSCGSGGEGDTLCDPGSVVFCRCRGFSPGDKQCSAAGDGFGPCISLGVTCDELPEPKDETSSSSSTGGGSKPLPGDGELYAPCTKTPDCKASLRCARGYCTKACADFKDCEQGDCVTKSGEDLCSPYCIVQKDCAAYGEGVSCSFTDAALPPFDVVVCANWDVVALPPDGYPASGNCDDDGRCHLGLDGKERVCGPEGCSDGCHVDLDCPGEMASCDAMGGEVGSCQTMPSGDLDACPGQSVSVDTMNNSNHVLKGDTSLLMSPDEASGEETNTCVFSSTPSEEAIYSITATEAGTLLALLSPDAGFDSQIYGRGGDCVTGKQLFCEDEIGNGQSEIVEVSMTQGETIWIFVDGWAGSAGPYQLELAFSK
jgi:hypothetical protein